MHGGNVAGLEQRQTFISLSLAGENLWCFENDNKKKISASAREHNADPLALNTLIWGIREGEESSQMVTLRVPKLHPEQTQRYGEERISLYLRLGEICEH